MSWTARRVLLTLGSASLASCLAADAVGPESASDLVASSLSALAVSTPDLGGVWLWSNAEELAFPEFVAALVGITPEGRLTHAHCASAGTMVLQQTGAAFEGTAVKTFNSCMTRGGQPFKQPGTAFDISDGRIAGRSIHFSFSSPIVTPCPHAGVISAVQGGSANALSGSGRCILPGHPQSNVSFPAEQPRGLSKTVAWEAVRP